MNKKQFSHDEFESLVDKAKQDKDILGLFYGGSRGKGFEDDASDWDLRYVVQDGTKQNYSADIENTHFEPSEFEDMEFQVFEYSVFKEHALNGTKVWDRYSFAHVTALIDKTGDIQYLIDKKWRLSEDEMQLLIPKYMDSYVHALYRSVKAVKREDVIGSGMQASMSVFHLVQALFASQMRVAPYHDYISKELMTYPLEGLPVTGKDLVSLLEAVVRKSSIESQQRLARVVEAYVKERNLYAYERWQDKYDWLMSVAD